MTDAERESHERTIQMAITHWSPHFESNTETQQAVAELVRQCVNAGYNCAWDDVRLRLGFDDE